VASGKRDTVPGLFHAAVASRSRVAASGGAQTAVMLVPSPDNHVPRPKASMLCVEQCAVPRVTHEVTKKVKRSALFYLLTSEPNKCSADQRRRESLELPGIKDGCVAKKTERFLNETRRIH